MIWLLAILVVVAILIITFILVYFQIHYVKDVNNYYNQTTPPFFNITRNPSKEDIGRDFLSKKRVVICGLIRNGEKFIPHMKHLEDIGALFSDYRILLVEND